MKEEMAAHEHILQMRKEVERNEAHLKQIEREKEQRIKISEQ